MRLLSAIKLIVVLAGTFWVNGVVWATIDAYEFESEQNEKLFRVLIGELRCPKCQNQNISDSNAGLAKDIKDRVYDLVQEGQSKQQITDYMVERYGNFITYRPPLNTATWFLWFGPFVVALLAVVVLLIVKRRTGKSTPVELKQAQQQQVSELLEKLEQLENKDKN